MSRVASHLLYVGIRVTPLLFRGQLRTQVYAVSIRLAYALGVRIVSPITYVFVHAHGRWSSVSRGRGMAGWRQCPPGSVCVCVL